MAAADLLPEESHATANMSLLAHLQKLSTATLNCEQQQSGARHHFTPVLQFTVQSASLKENILE